MAPRDVVLWAVAKVCDVVEHATSDEAVRNGEWPWAAVLHTAMWCLREMFDGASSLGGWADRVGKAATRVQTHLMEARHMKSAREAFNEASRLIDLRYSW